MVRKVAVSSGRSTDDPFRPYDPSTIPVLPTITKNTSADPGSNEALPELPTPQAAPEKPYDETSARFP